MDVCVIQGFNILDARLFVKYGIEFMIEWYNMVQLITVPVYPAEPCRSKSSGSVIGFIICPLNKIMLYRQHDWSTLGRFVAFIPQFWNEQLSIVNTLCHTHMQTMIK